MIKPQTLWGLFKTCEDAKWLGEICQALGRQNVKLDFGQKQMVNTIMLDSGWLDEAVDAISDKNRMNYLSKKLSNQGLSVDEQKELNLLISAKESKKKSKRSKQIQPNSAVENAENDLHDFNGLSFIHSSIHPSIHPSNNKDNSTSVVVEKGLGKTKSDETAPSDFSGQGLKFPRKRLQQIVTPTRMGDVLRPDEITPFIDYVIAKGFCERESNQTVTNSYIKSIARSWKSEGWADKNRHRITTQELHDAIQEMNQERKEKIPAECETRFWDFLASRSVPFTHKNGDMVTKYTVKDMINAWYNLAMEPERKRKQEAAEREAREDFLAKKAMEADQGILMEIYETMDAMEEQKQKGAAAAV